MPRLSIAKRSRLIAIYYQYDLENSPLNNQENTNETKLKLNGSYLKVT
jgi:hypothetical protein